MPSSRSPSPSGVWIDALNHPYLVDLIVQAAPPDVLRAFRATSRWWRRRVDALLARHLVLDGTVLSTCHGHACAARLHFGIALMPLLLDEALYGRYAAPMWACGWVARSADADADADADGRSSGSSVSFPDPVPFPAADVARTLDLSRTRVLDVRGAVRRGVLEAVARMAGRLDTLRVYAAATAASYPRSNACSATWWFGTHGAHWAGAHPLRARRVVVFGSLVPWHGQRTDPVHFCPPDAEELVVRLSYNPRAPLARLDALFPRTPASLRRAVFVFTRTDRAPVLSSHDQFGSSLSPAGVAASLTQAVIKLGVPVLFVGAEGLAALPGISDVPVEFVAEERYRGIVGEDTWALFTKEAGDAPEPRKGVADGDGFQHINTDHDMYAQSDRTAWRSLHLS